jgi:hypothetical protein
MGLCAGRRSGDYRQPQQITSPGKAQAETNKGSMFLKRPEGELELELEMELGLGT